MENIKHISPALATVRQALEGARFDLQNEKVLQGQVEARLVASGLAFTREARLSPDHIIDFLVGGVGVEIKIKKRGVSAKAIYQQCLDYCGHHQVQALLLVSNSFVLLPAELAGKPTQKLNLGLAWL